MGLGKMFNKIMFLGLLMLLSVYAVSASTPLYVNCTGGNDSNDGTTWVLAKQTIQEGINVVDSGGTVNVASGECNENIVINKSITLQGDGVDSTTINDTTNPTILLEADDVTIDGFKIMGGSAPYVVSNLIKMVTAQNNLIITNNHLTNSKGASIYLNGDLDSGVTAENYTINDNLIEYYAGDSCSFGGCQYRGIAIGHALNVEIKRNNITNANEWEYRSDNLTYGGYAIYLKDYTGSNVEDNDISKCFYGIVANSIVEETYIDNNTISECHRGIVSGEVFAKLHIINNVVSTRQDPVLPVNAKSINEQGILLGGDGDYYDSSNPYPYEVTLNHEVANNIVTGTNSTDSFGLGVMSGWWDKDYGASGNFTNNTVTGYKYGIKVWGTYAPHAGTVVDRTSYFGSLSFTRNKFIDNLINADVDAIWSGVDNGIDAERNYWDNATNPENISVKYNIYPFYTDAGLTSLYGAEQDTFDGDTTNFNNETDIENVSGATIEDTTYGKIVWVNPVNASSADFDTYITITDSSITLDSTQLDVSFDSIATLSLYNTGLLYPAILKDGVLCGNDCSGITSSGGNITFNVTGFTTYTATADSNLTIWDSTDAEGGSQTIMANENISFFANYTLSDGTIINESNEHNGSCWINFDGGGYVLMNFTGSTYNYTRQFTTSGDYLFGVICNSSVSGFDASTNDTFTISSPPPITGYVSLYGAGDVASITIDMVTIFILSIGGLIVIILIVLLVSWGRRKLK